MKLNSQQLGKLMLLISIGVYAHIYYPILQAQISYQTGYTKVDVTNPKSKNFGIIIPRLNINESITANVDPFNKLEYMPVLLKGIAHAQNSSLPGQSGSIYLFGHSSDNPFSITRYNTSFLLLGKLNPTDTITLYYQQERFDYKVRDIKTVSPFETNYLTKESKDQLILQTCTPLGTSINRLLVFADPITS